MSEEKKVICEKYRKSKEETVKTKKMLYSELESLSSGLINVEQVSNVKVLVGKEKKVFQVNSFLLASR